MFLFVAPFSTDSVFITCDLNLDMRFVLILNYKHVRTAGLREHAVVGVSAVTGVSAVAGILLLLTFFLFLVFLLFLFSLLLTSLMWLASLLFVALNFVVSVLMLLRSCCC
jgi:hypothetical protein